MNSEDIFESGLSRRHFIQGAILGGLGIALFPGMALAQARTDKRLVVIMLRGGMDGLAAVAPFGDPNYQNLRDNLALAPDSVLRLNDFYGLHPAFSNMHGLYQSGEMSIVHAVASPYRERSHFDGQNVLELGTNRPNDLKDGWLNRVIGAVNAEDQGLGMAIGQNVPLLIRGEQRAGSWAPSVLPETGDDFMSLVSRVYARDPMFARAFTEARSVQDKASDLLDMEGQAGMKMARQSRSPQAFVTMAKMAGKWLSDPDGPRIATLELGGWDTHAGQGAEGGSLANNFSLLDRGVAELKQALGREWSKTVVVAMTEFGRTARPNGDRGTDHGTGSCLFLMGGAVKGGRVVADWPGLARPNLYEERDLMPTTDVRSVMKSVLRDHYGLSSKVLNYDIYPKSVSVRKTTNLIRI